MAQVVPCLLYDCDVAQVGRFGGEVKEASGSGLLVGAPYAGLGLANFGKLTHMWIDGGKSGGEKTRDRNAVVSGLIIVTYGSCIAFHIIIVSPGDLE